MEPSVPEDPVIFSMLSPNFGAQKFSPLGARCKKELGLQEALEGAALFHSLTNKQTNYDGYYLLLGGILV